MSKIIFNRKDVPEFTCFVSKNRKNSEHKFVQYETAALMKADLVNRGLAENDVMVFAINNGKTASELIRDIVFLRTKHENAKVVVCLGEYSHISEVFELKPDYVMNLDQVEEKLMPLIDSFCEKKQEADDKVVIKKYGKTYCLNPDSIVCFIKENRRVKGVLSDGTSLIFRAKLCEMTEKLPDYFARCHISCIINLKKVTGVHDKVITLQGNTEVVVPVSRANRKEIKKLLENLNEGLN